MQTMYFLTLDRSAIFCEFLKFLIQKLWDDPRIIGGAGKHLNIIFEQKYFGNPRDID